MPYAVCAVPAGADLLVVAGQREKVRRYGGPDLSELPVLGVNNPVQDICALPVGDRWALFVTDEEWTYRFDAVTGEAWLAGS
ncbi:hypothetical protein [Actinoplanes palleronii]|uniref:Uncharacterized protein n=1 Tax=Actinoplanes palleronii TaxID=113570 RepID=A0ABQ4BQY9_9ACTN|nr:hypothetical protein [Actinoplanes palleronii]GIE73070.1 hypothetical protein Apa02nite_091780 [Actinoplanes palleronii]